MEGAIQVVVRLEIQEFQLGLHILLFLKEKEGCFRRSLIKITQGQLMLIRTTFEQLRQIQMYSNGQQGCVQG
jgi:hypothetical protein